MLTDEQIAEIRDRDIKTMAAMLMCVGDDVRPELYESFVAKVVESQKDVKTLRAEIDRLKARANRLENAIVFLTDDGGEAILTKIDAVSGSVCEGADTTTEGSRS